MNTTGDISAVLSGTTTTIMGRPATDALQIVAAPTLYKEFVGDPVQPGDLVTIVFTLSHDEFAPAAATDIAFTDDLSATLSDLTAIDLPRNDLCGAGSQLTGTTFITFTGGMLDPGASCTITATLRVPPAATPNNYPNTTRAVTAKSSA